MEKILFFYAATVALGCVGEWLDCQYRRLGEYDMINETVPMMGTYLKIKKE
jgi:hypothetical protein